MSSVADDVRNAIAAANGRFMAALAKGDAGGVAALYTASARILPPGSRAIGDPAGLKAFWASAMAMGIKRLELETLEVELHGDTAIEMGSAKIYGPSGDVIDDGKYIVVWKRESGEWKLHRDIWNSSRSPAE